MDAKQLNEEFEKLYERDRTFDDMDIDDFEEIVDSTYGPSYYIVSDLGKFYVYEKEDGEVTKTVKKAFKTRDEAIDAICHLWDNEINEDSAEDIDYMMDMGDLNIYDEKVEEYIKNLLAKFDDEEDEED